MLARLADGSELSAKALREELPELEGRIDVAVGKAYGANVALSPRVLTQLGVEGLVTRGRNGGHWRVSRPQWTSMAAWLGDVPEPWPAAEGWAEMVRRWLGTFGPGTAADIQWWLGGTVGIVKQALADLDAVPVSLDGGDTGWLLPDDLEPVTHDEPWAALLPVLDPTVMGWKSRGFYLDAVHVPAPLRQQRQRRHHGLVATDASWAAGCRTPPASSRSATSRRCRRPRSRALAVEAARLTAWLDGVRVGTVYPSAGDEGLSRAFR